MHNLPFLHVHSSWPSSEQHKGVVVWPAGRVGCWSFVNPDLETRLVAALLLWAEVKKNGWGGPRPDFAYGFIVFPITNATCSFFWFPRLSVYILAQGRMSLPGQLNNAASGFSGIWRSTGWVSRQSTTMIDGDTMSPKQVSREIKSWKCYLSDTPVMLNNVCN